MIFKNKLTKLLNTNSNLLFSLLGVLVLLVSFVGYYYFYDNSNIIYKYNTLHYIQKLNSNMKIISYLYIYLSVFSFILTIFHIKQYILNKKLKQKIYKDESTNLFNRIYLDEFLNNKINPKNFIIILSNIDNFKNINNTYGYDIGDKVINFVGTTIKLNINNEDFIIRFSGDEFLILINNQENIYNETSIYKKINNINNIIKNKIFKFNNLEFQITISSGINFYLDNIKTLDKSIKMANVALYKAKKEKNKIIMFTKENKKLFGLEENEIINLLNNNTLQLDLKPINDSKNNIQGYFSSFYFLDQNHKYTTESFENKINLNEKLLEMWLNITFKFIKKYYKKEIFIFYNIKASWLLNPNLFSIIDKFYKENIVLNIELDIDEYSIFIQKIKKLKLFYNISILNNNKIFNIIENYKFIDYLLIEKEELNYYFFINHLSKNYNIQNIYNEKFLNINEKKILMKNNDQFFCNI